MIIALQQISRRALFEQLLQPLKKIKRSSIINLVIGVLLGITHPTVSPWHFQSCTMHDLSFQAGSGRDPLLKTRFPEAEFQSDPLPFFLNCTI